MHPPSEDAYAKVRYLYDALTPKPPELLKNNRYYVREGQLQVWDENRRKKSKRYIFLLNDALLITKRDGRTKFWLRVFITLSGRTVTVENISNGFEYGFRLQISTGGGGWDSGMANVRSFVFYSESVIDSWVEDIEHSIGATGGKKSGKSSRNDDEDFSLGGPSAFESSVSAGSSSRRSAASPSKSSSRSSQQPKQQNFSRFTDGDFVEQKVNFDSGMKLGGIRSDRGDNFDAAPVPVLAPPPRGSPNAFMSAPQTQAQPQQMAPLMQPPPTASTSSAPAPAPANSQVTSLEDFLGLGTSTQTQQTAPATYDFFGAPALTPTAPAQQPTAPAQTSNVFDGLGQPQQPQQQQFNPFGPTPTQSSQPPSLNAAYASSGIYSQQQNQPSPFGAPAPAAAANPFGAPPAQQQQPQTHQVDWF